MDIACKLIFLFVTCLCFVNVYCSVKAEPGCGQMNGECAKSNGGIDKQPCAKCKCGRETKPYKKPDCIKCCLTTGAPSTDRTTPVDTSPTQVPTPVASTTGKRAASTISTSGTSTTTSTTTPTSRIILTSPTLKRAQALNNTDSYTGETNNEEDRVFSKDFIIGMIAGALSVGIVITAIVITCFVCCKRNERIQREIRESYEKRYEKHARLAMIGNEVCAGASLHRGLMSASASTLRTSVSPDACYVEIEQADRISHCSLPDVMDKVVDPTSGYAFYKSDRPSMYNGLNGKNARTNNISYGLHRIDRPTIYTGHKQNTNIRRTEKMEERVYEEAKEVVPERVLNENNHGGADSSHSNVKINETEQNHRVETCPIVPIADVNHTEIMPASTSPYYFKVNNENENHPYQMLHGEIKREEMCDDIAEYQPLHGNHSQGDCNDNRLPTYFTLEQ